MPFDEAFTDIYLSGIKSVAKSVGAYAERLDEQVFTEGMLERIYNQISRADVIIADMTGQNVNVFYEVGYAHALGKQVLLLTQRADDIPFDLKHRTHIVYSGKIEELKKKLKPKLRWFIDQAGKEDAKEGAEQFGVQIGGRICIRPGESPLPVILGVAKEQTFSVPVLVRNEGRLQTDAVTHVYLFVDPSGNLEPSRLLQWKEDAPDTSFVRLSSFHPVPSVFGVHDVAIESFSADAVDAQDGLTNQYRLDVALPPMPPRAIESFDLRFKFVDKHQQSDASCRLRICTRHGHHDFRFRLGVTLATESDTSALIEQPTLG